jgi:hypothetical protein
LGRFRDKDFNKDTVKSSKHGKKGSLPADGKAQKEDGSDATSGSED